MLRDSWRAYREGVAQNFEDVEHIPKVTGFIEKLIMELIFKIFMVVDYNIY
jgi:hypothetical protein